MQTRGDSDERRKESLRENLISAMRTTQDLVALGERELSKLDDRVARADTANRPAFQALLAAVREAQRSATAERLRRIRIDHYRKLVRTRRERTEPRPEAAMDWDDV